MSRSRLMHSRWLCGIIILLVMGQCVALVGFPSLSNSKAQVSACGTGACGCRTLADQIDASCCCSKRALTRSIESSRSCCASESHSADCQLFDHDPPKTLIWVTSLAAKGCKQSFSSDWLTFDPAVLLHDSAFEFLHREWEERVVIVDSLPNSRSLLPPVRPPRSLV